MKYSFITFYTFSLLIFSVYSTPNYSYCKYRLSGNYYDISELYKPEGWTL